MGGIALIQQGGEPTLIKELFLVGRLPEGTNLSCLRSFRKGLLFYPQCNQLFAMTGFEITVACFPFSHRSSRDTKVLSQAFLRQTNRGSQV